MPSSTGTTRLFVDEVTIHVRGGKGGDGCMSFRREKFVPKGGPDGGEGGHGGSVFLVAHDGIDTLLDLAGRHHYRAQNGRPGSGSNCTGRRGADLLVPVPTGTLAYDAEGDRLLKDLVQDGQRVRVAQGGRGGHGNLHFVSSTHQAPREFTAGGLGQERTLRLELKLIADIGLVGLPNAGKSTLLSRCSAARPKIASYPFTTLEPVLGIVELSDYRRFVMADIPGLIEGASTGAGLGHEFLRHIERTKIIVHILDLMPTDGSDPVANYHAIRAELAQHSETLASKEEVIVANKIDLDPDGSRVKDLQDRLSRDIVPISAATGQGIKELAELLWQKVRPLQLPAW
jgi:GTP-binding protein